jgi:hypothetical protein
MASRGRVCRTGMFAARLLINLGAVGAVVFFSAFTPATAAAATYSISGGSTTPISVAPGQTVAIKANFTLGQAGTVATYFELRNSSNVIMTDQSYNSQVFSAGQVRSYTWNFTVPSNWAAGTYRVDAGIFAADWSSTLQWVSGSSTFGVAAASGTTSTSSISSGSATPSSLAAGQTVAIKADFSVSQAATVSPYFEIRNSSNAITTTKWYYSQVFSAGQVRSYTWSFVVPSTYAAGTYRVNAVIFAADRITRLKSVSGISSFAVTTAAPSPTPTPTPAPPPTTTGRQFYVDNVSGSDSNSGTSSTAPWKSLGKVNSIAFQPGDAVNFKRGSVWTGNLQVKSSGTSSSRITYQAYGTGTAPQIKNPGVAWGHAVDLTGSYNVVQDLLITDAFEAGVMINTGAGHNVVQRNEITRTGTGVTVSSQYNLLTGNYVHDLTMIVNDSTPDTDYGAVCFWLQAANNEVSYNRGINCRAPSYDFGYDGGFVEVWQTGDNTYVHHNYAQNTNGFFELGAGGGGSAQNIKVAYNVINNTNGGVCFNQGSYNISVANFKFENNTYVATTSKTGYRVLDCTNDYSAVQMRNNIFYSNLQIANNGNFTHSNNLYYMVNMVNGSGVGYSLGAGERTGNPLFVNLAGGDYHLQLTSPAIDAGTDLGYTKDVEDHPVPQAVSSLIPDIGAFEFGPGR